MSCNNFKMHGRGNFYVLVLLTWSCCIVVKCETNLPPVFTQQQNNIVLKESVPVGTVVYKLEGYDPEGSNVTFGSIGSEYFDVDPISGNITVIKPLDREERDSIPFLITIKDRVNPEFDSDLDNIVRVPITVIVTDENDNPPIFQNTPYEADVDENAAPGTVIFKNISIKDRDSIGDSLDIKCEPLTQSPDACEKFRFEIISRDPTQLTASVVLNGTLNYNQRMIYHFQIEASDGVNQARTNFEVRVRDVQDKPPVFQGSLSTVIDEDSPINTLLLKVHARDGDTGEPRKIVYDLLTNPMDYFLLDERTGELRTAKPLDRESLPDSTGLITLTIRAREVVNGAPSNDASTSSIANATITIKDVNDTPPQFNKKEYEVSLPENTAPGTPLALQMDVTDRDVGMNSKFAIHLIDVSGVFEVEPQLVNGYSKVNVRVGNATLDYENPNQRKFIVLAVAEETDTSPKLSSTATITVTVLDANDNKPKFEQESYTASVSEAALPGQYITTITAKDIDSGDYGDAGIRYQLSGIGAELFTVDDKSGVISLANCHKLKQQQQQQRTKRQLDFFLDNHNDDDMTAEVESDNDEEEEDSELLTPADYIGSNIVNYTSQAAKQSLFNVHDVVSATSSGNDAIKVSTESTLAYTLITQSSVTNDDELVTIKDMLQLLTTDTTSTTTATTTTTINTPPVDSKLTCLDYETENTYFLTFKATDDNGQGQTSVVSLRISVTDANDSPPICESPLYRASIDEGSQIFDSPLIIRAHDADSTSMLTYRIVGSKQIAEIVDIDKHTGQITIRPNATLDVTQLNSDKLIFDVEASDGHFTTRCAINITVRDVNNHSPRFLQNSYAAVIEENSEIGTSVQKLQATDQDSGINAQIKYRIQHGSFDDFRIDDKTGEVFVSRKLDFDRRNTYQIEVLATDYGTPSLSGTATLKVTVVNSNDKDPYFTPTTQHAEVREDVPVGTIVHVLVAIDPDIANHNDLEFAGTDDITAIDKDGIEVKNKDTLKDYFAISRDGKVVVNRALNRQLFAILRINVLVTDSTAPNVQQGRGLLIINIVDVNEIPPTFNAPWSPENPVIKLQMLEEQPIGSILTILQATDEDSSIADFDISENAYFDINRTTGVITTKARLDYETQKEVKFVATVTDTGVPQLNATAEVIVDIINLNDNEPNFLQNEYHFNITENSPAGTVVGKVEAFDADLGTFGEVTYSLMGENKKYFSIDAYTGSLIVTNATILDREKVKLITIKAVAQDKAPSTVQKTVIAPIYIHVLDVNDNAPIFNQAQYVTTVAENAALNPPAVLMQVQAKDLDEGIFGEVRYFVTSGNEAGLFRLDAKSGILYPAQELEGKKGVYNLIITARDIQGSGTMESQTKATIIVQAVNQHRPVFIMPALSNATVEIPGDKVKPNYLLLTVKAVDNDTDENGLVSYHLQVDNQNVQETDEFKIDVSTGELRTKIELNRKETANYNLILVARDGGNPAAFETLRFLSVSIVDANENRPEFPDNLNPYKFSISENSGRNIKVGRIQAMARSKHSKDIYYYMLLGNEDGAFLVDKITGEIFTNKNLDREETDAYTLYILASMKPDLHISEEERAAFSFKTLDRDNTVAKVRINVLDENDNGPVFEKENYYGGINAKAVVNALITTVNATDADAGRNAKIEYMIIASNLYKFGATKSTGSIVPSPFSISAEGRINTAAFMAEYNQDRFELEILAQELELPQRTARTKVHIWIYDSSQLVRVILSRPPEEVYQEQEEIVAELKNAIKHRIIVDEIRFHVDSMGRIRMDWCDLFFHAVDARTKEIAAVDDILKLIDANYDALRDYYAGFAIETVGPAYVNIVPDEFDLAIAGLVALLIVLFVGVISVIVLCCCLKHWNLTVPVENRRKEALIKKQIIEDLNTTENPLWIEQKLKLYEEQELTMQVFSEPEVSGPDSPTGPMELHRQSLDQIHHSVDNTYATIQPRNLNLNSGSGTTRGNTSGITGMRTRAADTQLNDFADYATLRNNRAPSMYEFTGSTFQAPIREGEDVGTDLL